MIRECSNKQTMEYVYYCKSCKNVEQYNLQERMALQNDNKVIKCSVCGEKMDLWKRLNIKEYLGVKEDNDGKYN